MNIWKAAFFGLLLVVAVGTVSTGVVDISVNGDKIGSGTLGAGEGTITPQDTVSTAGVAQSRDTANPTASLTPTQATVKPVAGDRESAPRTPLPNAAADSAGVDRFVVEKKVAAFVNDERKEAGLDPINFQWRLVEIARYHSRDMAVRGYLAHDAPDGQTMAERYDLFGYDCKVKKDSNTYATGAENIQTTWWKTSVESDFRGGFYSTGTDLAAAIVHNWMQSKPHRKNIMTPYWQNQGIGVWVQNTSAGWKVYVTQNFC